MNVLNVFYFPGCCTKGSKIKRVIVVQTHVDDGENVEFFFAFPPKSVIYTKKHDFVWISAFKKNPPFFASWTCVWTITLSILEPLV